MADSLKQAARRGNRPDSPGLRALKLLVVVMGVLIVAGVAVIVVTIATRLSDRAERSAAAGRQFGEVRLALPAGARLAGMAAGDGRMLLRLGFADGRAALLVVDSATGERLGLIWLDAN